MAYNPPRRSDGTIEHYREKLPWPKDKQFRILSIDGGGICGILPASILSELERRYLSSAPIGGYFDMVAGTSTGGIIALGLAKGFTATQIRDVYVDRGQFIFPPATGIRRFLRNLRRVVHYVYDPKSLREELLILFGNDVLASVRGRVCIPAFEGRYGEPWIYKTPHHPDYDRDQHELLVDVCMATASAPTYLKSFARNGYVMVDGGIWANNPVMNAVVDALACYQLDPRQIRVLSLGCGETSFRVTPGRMSGGLFQWRHAIRAAMRAQSLNALGQAYLLLGKDHVVRLDAPESKKPIALDDVSRACAELPQMARSLVEGAGRSLASTFLHPGVNNHVPPAERPVV